MSNNEILKLLDSMIETLEEAQQGRMTELAKEVEKLFPKSLVSRINYDTLKMGIDDLLKHYFFAKSDIPEVDNGVAKIRAVVDEVRRDCEAKIAEIRAGVGLRHQSKNTNLERR